MLVMANNIFLSSVLIVHDSLWLIMLIYIVMEKRLKSLLNYSFIMVRNGLIMVSNDPNND